ncbi:MULTISPECIES: hypothetical protein [unclassified Halorhabdus]|uniref:hypothetical protein n=1 Tax=unclassified Halorhabdus TaxID=2621901 RepID=UPI0023DA6FE3|nr:MULTISPECIES: hypothetical protein [unclassified Halorhabdus]WEL17054.1 hypothetical protein SVXHr_0879 [Halorhabdus sp. SVX81]WEL20939.1 hypothetical protein HBNXHr_0870 [Halorhabdus sp. BNX81]
MSVDTKRQNGQLDVGTGLIGVGTLVAIVGAFLPWLTAGGWLGESTASGLTMISDAALPIYSPILTVGLAVLAVVLSVGVPDNDLARMGEIAAGVVMALVAVIFVVSPETVFGGGIEGAFRDAVSDPGIGIIATLAAGIAIAVGGAVNMSG